MTAQMGIHKWHFTHSGFAAQASQYAAETYESVKDASAQAGTKASQVASDAYDTAADASQQAYKHASNAANQVSVIDGTVYQGHATQSLLAHWEFSLQRLVS